MKKILAALILALLCLPAAWAEEAARALHWIDGGQADRVHLRAAPSAQSTSLGLYFTGTQVILLGEENGWAHVLAGTEEGWIMEDYLAGAYLPQSGPWQVVDNANSTWVNLRTAPSMNAAVSMRQSNGTRIRLLGETADGWSYVDCSGAEGYILTGLLTSGDEGKDTATTVLGQTADFYYIHRYTAPNGQDIYFTAMEDDVYIDLRDVNFDGFEDIVVDTVMGANNFFSEFFVYDATGGAYVRVMTDSSEERLCNVSLHPEWGIVSTHWNGGYAGLLHVTRLYRWEGATLKLLRSAVSDEWSEDVFEGQSYTSIVRGDLLHMTVCDHDGSVLWELVVPVDDVDYQQLFEEETNALWQGIR